VAGGAQSEMNCGVNSEHVSLDKKAPFKRGAMDHDMKNLIAPSAQRTSVSEDDAPIRRVVTNGNATHKNVPVRCPACDRTVKRRSRRKSSAQRDAG